MFIDKVDEPILCLKLLKVLRKLNEHLPEVVGEQFFGNPSFPEAVITYLENTPLESLAGDALICFVNVFDEVTTPEFITDNFVTKLINAMEYIDDESTLHSLIGILVCLFPTF